MWNRSENQIKIVLIRHGITWSNQEHRYLGKQDESLCEEGILKLQLAWESAVYPKADYVFGSPMRRCVETAKIIYPSKEIIVIPEWTEMDFGDFEGKNYIELAQDERYQEWIDSGGELPFPGGEDRVGFVARCKKGMYRMMEIISGLENAELENSKLENKKLYGGLTIGMIVHGGTIMALLSSFAGGKYFDYQVSNGNGYRGVLQVKEGQPKLLEIKKLMRE